MATDPLIGTTIGGCMILEVIGQGGMGVIYKARQKSLDRIVALKVLAPHLANDANFVGRFQREARAIARVNHPNILAVYDVGDDQNTNYMIMELIDGQSLAELQTDRRGALPFDEAANFIRQAAQGLEAAQASGIIHRDIKPENLMVTKKGIIKVSDFGLAKDADATTTSTDAVMGTPAFMSPEQCDGKKVDGRSDIYSLGGTFYRLITGRLPFEAETAMSMMYRHKHEALIPPHEVVPTLSPTVSEIIIKMMAKKREQRYQTMTEVIDAIDVAKQPVAKPQRAEPRHQANAMPPSPQMHLPPMQALPPMPPLDPSELPPPPPAGMLSHDESNISGRRPLPVTMTNPGVSRTQPVSSRMPATQAPAGGFGSPDSSARMSMPSGLIGGMAPGIAIPDDAYTAVASGDEALARGDRTNAMKAYRKALQGRTLDNATRARIEGEIRKELTARRQAADNLLKKGMLVEASREFRILMEIDPTDEGIKAQQKELDSKLSQKRTLVNDIRTAIASSQFERSIKIWDSTPAELRDDGLSKQIEQLRSVVVPSFKLAEQGDSFAKQGRLEEAIATFEDALKINAACETARIGLKDAEQKIQRIEYMLKEGYQYSLEQNYAKAVETWKPILQLRPGHPQTIKSMLDAYVAHAQYLRSQGDLEGALNAYKGAAECDPQNRSVKKVMDDLTNLFDKESALVDRANDAAARNNLGAAIKYWREVQRINPANKRASMQMIQLGKARSGGRAKFMAVAFVLLLAGAAGYQYWTEMRLVKSLDQAMEAKQYTEIPSLLGGARIFFLGAQIEKIRTEANINLEVQKALKMAAENSPEAPSVLRKQAELFRSRNDIKKANELIETANQLEIKLWNKNADAALADGLKADDITGESKFATASSVLGDMCAAVQLWQRPSQEVQDAVAQAEKENGVIDIIRNGLLNKRNNNKPVAMNDFRLAQAQAKIFTRVPGVDTYVAKQLASLGADEKGFKESMEKARTALAVVDAEGQHTQLVEAAKLFESAREQGANKSEVTQLLQYIDDINTCEKSNNMRLYQPSNPLTSKQETPWTRNNRAQAFCIDRFEYPNEQGKMPMTAVLYEDAVKLCKDRGKVLCTVSDWENACKGGSDFSQSYPYGAAGIEGNCNTTGKAPVASGSKKPCRNSIGVYDMSGNLAEWVDDPSLSASLQGNVKGGSYNDAARLASCLDSDPQRNKTDKAKDVGFRCCLKLSGLDQ